MLVRHDRCHEHTGSCRRRPPRKQRRVVIDTFDSDLRGGSNRDGDVVVLESRAMHGLAPLVIPAKRDAGSVIPVEVAGTGGSAVRTDGDAGDLLELFHWS